MEDDEGGSGTSERVGLAFPEGAIFGDDFGPEDFFGFFFFIESGVARLLSSRRRMRRLWAAENGDTVTERKR